MFVRHTRRGFLQLLSALGLGGIMPVTGFSQGKPTDAGATISRPIPGTAEMLPLIGFGSSAAAMAIPETGPAPVERLIETLVRLGGTMIDTAPRQESLDEAFGALLTDPRWHDRLFVNTKVGRNRAEKILSQDAEGVINQMRRTERLFGKRPSDLVLI